jgi:hypothetical protein
MRVFFLILLLILIAPQVSGQKKLSDLLGNERFQWKSDSTRSGLILYTEHDGYSEQYESILLERIHYHIL